jgi:hypothetical protein
VDNSEQNSRRDLEGTVFKVKEHKDSCGWKQVQDNAVALFDAALSTNAAKNMSLFGKSTNNEWGDELRCKTGNAKRWR